MTEWLVEEGIGEHRAVLLAGDRIVAARLHWPGGLTAGQVEEARLIARQSGTARGTARFASGEEAQVDHLPPAATHGSTIRLEVRRAQTLEPGRRKLARARPTTLPVQGSLTLAEQLQAQGKAARLVHRFPPDVEWPGLWLEAREGTVPFNGGSLLFYATPAMTLVDVDGDGDPGHLALAAVPAVAAAIDRLDLSGNIGVDFPTLTEKTQRRAVDDALARALGGWQHERTAMNGFGFVQLVSRVERPSVLALLAHAPAGGTARNLLRDAEGLSGPGALLLRCSPAVAAALRPQWLDALQRRTGRHVRVEIANGALDPAGAHAQLVPHV